MTSKQWEEVKDLFYVAINEPPDDLDAFLASKCNDEEIRSEVSRLLLEHNKAGDFLADPPWINGSSVAQPSSIDLGFVGTLRFVVQERLGEGAFGIVYRVLDRERNTLVALKTLRCLEANQLSRFKHEFRSLVDLIHPNLVQLYELFGDDRGWFYTMELIHGVDFIAYSRPGDVIEDWDRLRDALVQLTLGVQALHSSARLHRDLKPSNVLVTTTGQVSILDFGLVKDIEAQSAEQSIALAGSPAYMAPEQFGRGKITAAVDWYAVGVMLYRAITGVLPFKGDWQEVLERKHWEDPKPPPVLNPDVPEDLNEICCGLLERSPDSRADGKSILERLRHRSEPCISNALDPFVGRSYELNLLSECFRAMDLGRRQIVLLQGQSGIGKSTLVNRFLSIVKNDRPEAVILKGRCRESESVPYKAIDSVIDQLVAHLQALPPTSASALLPRHPALLVRLFPIFARLEALSAFTDRLADRNDEQQVRRLAFAAICETLARMADRRPVLISIDDLQWADLDSIAFLTELIAPAHAPALILILTFRSEDVRTSPALLLLRTLRAGLANPECWVDIELAGLPLEEGRDLLRSLDRDRALAEEQLRQMALESMGSPLFLRELFRVTLEDIDQNEQSSSGQYMTVAEMIKRRVSALSPAGRQVLEALCVSVEPLPKATLYRTVEASESELSREIRSLIRDNLIRVTGGTEAGKLEPFHDQVREASLLALSSAALKSWHLRLANAFESEEVQNPQKLVRHYLGAGDMAKAFRSAIDAAEIAKNALAFDRAAEFYGEAIATGAGAARDVAILHRQRAEALAKACRGREAANEYLYAASCPEYNDAFEMKRLASEQLMRSGHLAEGIEEFKDLLRSVGFWMPATPMQSIFAMLVVRAFIRVRGLRWRHRHEAELPRQTIRNLDLLWSGASTLFIFNPVFGTYLQARHMLEALRSGEPLRLALAVGQGAPYEALGGVPYYENGRKFLEFAEQIASELQDSYLSCALSINWVFVDFLCGRIRNGLEHSRRAVQILNELGTERNWERSTAKFGLIWFLSWGGRIREMARIVPGILDEARSRGDVYTLLVIRCGALSHRVDLAADNPDRALDEISQALGQMSQARYGCPHFIAAFSSVECELYAGRLEQARRRVLAEWRAQENSLLFRKCQTFKIMLYYMRARTALAMRLQGRGDHAIKREIERCVSLLRSIRAPWGVAIGDALQSSVEAGRGRVREAILLLDRAETVLHQEDFQLMAAALSRRRGELEGEAGDARVRAADAFMRSENILRPDRMAFMILPS